MRHLTLPVVFALGLNCATAAQFADSGWGTIAAAHEYISPQAEQELWQTIQANIARLRAQGKLAEAKADLSVRFGWPTRLAPGRPEFLDHFVVYYVDQNPAVNSTRDYNCGTRTYDTESPGGGHKGTDISLGRRAFYKQDTEQVVVVAAADGTIMAKDDSNPDRYCGDLASLLAKPMVRNNVISIRHADGSVGIYLHLKTGSLTPKNIGDTVVEGEYLGVVGSAGYSAGPHLHFEVRDANNNVIDPWLGSCNTSTTVSLWKLQQPYYMQEIMELMPASSPPTSESLDTACVDNVAANESASGYTQPNLYVQPGVQHSFIAFVRDIQNGNQVVLALKRPDGSQYTAPTFTSTGYAAQSYWFVNRTIPASEPAGKWSFQVTYAGKTKSVPFYFNLPTPAPARVYEFYHAGLDHYFRTAEFAEAQSLTPISGFLPTGDDFLSLDRNVVPSGVLPVCRFYGSVEPGPNSHFYTADPAECNWLKYLQAQTPASVPRWNFEEIAFASYLPVNGVCPTEAPFPIYRVYNRHVGEFIAGRREDSNHRYTTFSSIYNKMIGQGWSAEGVVMCAGSKP